MSRDIGNTLNPHLGFCGLGPGRLPRAMGRAHRGRCCESAARARWCRSQPGYRAVMRWRAGRIVPVVVVGAVMCLGALTHVGSPPGGGHWPSRAASVLLPQHGRDAVAAEISPTTELVSLATRARTGHAEDSTALAAALAIVLALWARRGAGHPRDVHGGQRVAARHGARAPPALALA